MTVTTSLIVQSGNEECQDRAAIVSCGARTVFALADGAGGISGGAQAADRFIRRASELAGALGTAADCATLLRDLDQLLAQEKDCGETTAIIAIVDPQRLFGASIGDSAAWLFASDGMAELTYGQPRKPLLGSGKAPVPREFSWPIEEGTVVIASDGLWNYTQLDAVRSRVQTRDSTDLAMRLAELARLTSGTFPDDIAVITARIALS